MHALSDGFRIDDRCYPWGTTLAAVAESLGMPFDADPRVYLRRLRLPCKTGFGFPAARAEAAAPGMDRPVTSLWYELAPLPDMDGADPALWTGPLTGTFGPPSQAAPGTGAHAATAGGVRYHARWALGQHEAGLSLYGKPRLAPDGLSTVGGLWLSWSARAAGLPFLPEWQARCAALAALPLSPWGARRFLTRHPLTPHLGDGLAEAERQDAAAEYALNAPHILPTPAAIAAGLPPEGFALHRSGDGLWWCLSTRWDSLLFRAGEPVVVEWHDVLSARGAGHSLIEISGRGGWHARDVSGSKVMAQAVAELRAVPGVEIRHHQYHDC